MATAFSLDLRSRALAAVDGGLSCRQAALRFGVSASSVIRWAERRRKEGSARLRPQGGDRRSGRIEAHCALILAMLAETPDITLAELRSKLAGRGIGAGIGTLWRFFYRHRMTLKKSRPMPASRTGPIS